jgi:hypothetical protein
MKVAAYALFGAGCHIHGLIEGLSQAERGVTECCRSARPDPAFTGMIRQAPQVRRVAVHAGWADPEPQAGQRHVTAKHQHEGPGINTATALATLGSVVHGA